MGEEQQKKHAEEREPSGTVFVSHVILP